jgi:LysM repeat protein
MSNWSWLACGLVLGVSLGCGSPYRGPGRPMAGGPGMMTPVMAPGAAGPVAYFPGDVTVVNTSPVPLGTVALTPAPAATALHRVQAGETLTNVAERYQVTVEQLRQANGLSANAALTPGQTLSIPTVIR